MIRGVQKVDYDENGVKRNIVGKVTVSELAFDITAIDKKYTHNQIVPSTTWTINHPLEKFASVFVVDSAGTVVQGVVKMITQTQIVLEFSYAFAGTAYLN